MRDELDWLRSSTPPVSDPDDLVLRRARHRLLTEIDQGSEPADEVLEPLPVPGVDPVDAESARVRHGTGRGSRIAVLGTLAAAAALIVGVVWVSGSDESEQPELADPTSPEPSPTTTELAATTTTTTPPEAEQPSDQITSVPVGLSDNAPLADGQLVAVTAEGLDGSSVWVAQCLADRVGQPDDLQGCDLTTLQITSAVDGSVAVDFRVHRHLELDDGTVDCTTSDCAVAVASLHDHHLSGTAPIALDPTAPSVDAPALFVDPGSDLVDGQEIVVTGTGLEASSELRLVQCVVGVVEVDPNCFRPPASMLASTNPEVITTDPDGQFDATLFASRLPLSMDGAADCALLEVGRCVLAAITEERDGEPQQLVATRPLTYDPSVAPPSIGVDVDPASALSDGETVAIAVTGGQDHHFHLCVVGLANRCTGLTPLDPNRQGSTLTASTRIPRLLDGRDGHRHDCLLDGPCELRVQTRGAHLDPLPRDFDPDAPLGEPTPIDADPAGTHRPGDVIALTLPDETTVDVRQCVVDSATDVSIWDRCDVHNQTHADESPDGSVLWSTGPFVTFDRTADDLAIQIVVYRRIELRDGRVHDCVTDGPCELVIRPRTGIGRYEPVTLEFDRAVPPLDDPEITLDKNTNLVDGETVTVAVSGLAAAVSADVQLCPANTPISTECASITTRRLTGTGEETFTVDLPRLTVAPVTGRIHDCDQGCLVRLTTDRFDADASVEFDPTADPPPPASLALARAPTSSGEDITVTASGFRFHPSLDDPVDSYICEREPDGLWTTSELIRRCARPLEPLWLIEPVVAPDGTFTSRLVVPADVRRLSARITRSCVDDPCWLVVRTGDAIAGPTQAAALLTGD